MPAIKPFSLPMLLLGFLILSSEIIASAQGQDDPPSQTQDSSEITVGGIVIDGPPPPIPPSVITRDGGQATMRAIKLTEPLEVDGRLDESIYDTVEPVSDFLQQLPDEGALSTERTDAWVMYCLLYTSDAADE